MGKKIDNSDYFRIRLNSFLDFTGISRKKISEIIDINYQQLTKVLTGQTKTIDVNLINSLVINLDLNPIWFFTDKGPKKLSEIEIVDKSKKDALEQRVKKLESNQKVIIEKLLLITEDVTELEKLTKDLEDLVE